MSTAAAPVDPAAPRAPRITATGPWSEDELDPQYPDIDGVELAAGSIRLPEARMLSILRSRLSDCELEVDPSVPIEVQDCELTGVDLTGHRITGLHRVRLERCRLGGADLGDARVRDVELRDCVLDLSVWRAARLERVALLGGRVDGMELDGAQLGDVTVADVRLAEVSLDGVRAERVDLTGADVSEVRDVVALRGCTISIAQTVALAARSARALGVQVRAEA